jgi:hypothetical protein
LSSAHRIVRQGIPQFLHFSFGWTSGRKALDLVKNLPADRLHVLTRLWQRENV